MTLAHRITAVYAIVITSLLVGLAQGNRQVLKLEMKEIPYALTETDRSRIVAHTTVPYIAGGVVAGLLFLAFTRQPKTRK